MSAKPNQSQPFGVKFLLTTFSLTLVLGFWNMFAKKAQADQTGSNLDLTSSEPWTESIADEFVLPTLVPQAWAPLNALSTNADDDQVVLPEDMREVYTPTQRPVVQQQAPVVESVVIGGQQPQPQTNPNPQNPRPQPTPVATTAPSK